MQIMGGNSTARRRAGLAMIPTLNLMTSVMALVMDNEPVPKPFQAVWNYPDSACRNSGIDFNLGYYGIESNRKDFKEDTIALYYSSLIGKWPYFEFGEENDTAVHGGWPHYIDMSKHLDHVRAVVAAHQSPSSAGFGVIDMELWRPLLNTNYGRYLPYREKIVDLVAAQHPDKDGQQHKQIARTIWELSTQYLMVLSLTMAKMTRPKVKWGYYGYPELTTAPHNHKLDWLWRLVSAYYPSIYIKDFSVSPKEIEEKIKATIAESFRVRALYGDPEDPIMAYTNVQNIPEGDQQNNWLRLAIQLPLDLGADGIILWSSSSNISPGVKEKCLKIQEYVRSKVGPFILNQIKSKSRCSAQLCNHRGRCVRRTYARSIPYLLNRGYPWRKTERVVEPLAYSKVGLVYKRYYMCQCRKGWYGRRCVQQEVKEEQ